MTCNRTVGRNLNYVEFVNIPELTSFCACSTGHTREFVVHTEIVLECDSCECLSSSLNLYMLLSFDSLMQAIAPATTFHDTTSLLIDNLHFAIHDNIFVVLIKHGISFQQLLKCVNSFTLYTIVCQHLVFLVETFLVRDVCASFQLTHLCSDIRQYEKFLIVYLFCQPVCTLVGKVG